MTEPTNLMRAAWAKEALAVFTALTYGGEHPISMHPVDIEDAICDLIADLLHLARQQAFNPALIAERAEGLFACEEHEEAAA